MTTATAATTLVATIIFQRLSPILMINLKTFSDPETRKQRTNFALEDAYNCTVNLLVDLSPTIKSATVKHPHPEALCMNCNGRYEGKISHIALYEAARREDCNKQTVNKAIDLKPQECRETFAWLLGTKQNVSTVRQRDRACNQCHPANRPRRLPRTFLSWMIHSSRSV
jgi:hypothetical protein